MSKHRQSGVNRRLSDDTIKRSDLKMAVLARRPYALPEKQSDSSEATWLFVCFRSNRKIFASSRENLDQCK